jgi:nicotinate-nucleotide adenylyltransferase
MPVNRNSMIGIFGGTFDPVHYGHLRPALELFESLSLQEVRMVPCATPPHRDLPVAAAKDRLAMLQLAVRDEPGMVVDEREMARGGRSYMVDTLRSLREELGDVPLCLLLGSDAFMGLATWHEWQQLVTLAHIVVAHRPGWQLDQLGTGELSRLLKMREITSAEMLSGTPAGHIMLHPVTPLAISATAIRALIAEGKSARFLLPDKVWEYIQTNKLYR